MPEVSIIVPVYKVERFLRQCVDSILAQSYQDFEVILIDDGSPDNCGTICDEYALQDNRVKVIHQANSGLSSARNAGLDTATGAYIAFVDSDDWITQDMIEKLYNRCCAEEADVAVCDVAVYIPDKGIVKHHSPMKDECLSQAMLVQKMIEPDAWHYIIACNKLYRRELFDTIRFPDGYIHEDAAIAHRIAGQCSKIVSIAQELYFYRQNPDSITGSEYSIRRTDNLSALADRIQYSDGKGWYNMLQHTVIRYVHLFLDEYLRFPMESDNKIYFDRMESSLKTAFPFIIQSSVISMRHKIHICLIRYSSGIYRRMKRLD